MINIGAISFSVGATLFLFLVILLMTAWRGRLQGGLLIAAVVISALWLATLAYHSVYEVPHLAWLESLEILRNIAWFAFLLRLLGFATSDQDENRLDGLHLVSIMLYGLCGSLLFLLISSRLTGYSLASSQAVNIVLLGFVLMSIAGLALVEHLYRNSRPERRWAIKFLCFGLGGMFVYDFFLYSDALLFKFIDDDLWNARGAINAMIVPLIAVSASRNPQWSVSVFVSRGLVFHSATLMGAGAYLLVMAATGYYIRSYGGEWGTILQITFLFGAILLLFVLLLSGQLRAYLKFFLSRHFYGYKYDYREEWLRFTRALTAGTQSEQLYEGAIRSIAGIVESPFGILWVRGDTGGYEVMGCWEFTEPVTQLIDADSPLVSFLANSEVVINLNEYADNPETYPGLQLPQWIGKNDNAWLIVPLIHNDELLGIILLCRSRARLAYSTEDSNLLLTVGRQAAGYIALLQVTEALSDARQFEAFNRLSAYVVHDLKNMVAQLSLIVSNAKNHINNPEFMDDAIKTVDNAVVKMNRLLAQLRKDRLEAGNLGPVNLAAALSEVVARRSVDQPKPELSNGNIDLSVWTDHDRLLTVLEHIIQNAQEATEKQGNVTVCLTEEQGRAVIEVKDDGKGMDEEFIRKRLFRPFDTTKGNAGMGIGVYESREFVNGNGGKIEVKSEPGKGTLFRIMLPIHQSDSGTEKAGGLSEASH